MAVLDLTLAELITETRSKISHVSGGNVSDTEITQWINIAQQDVQVQTRILRQDTSYALVAKQYDYNVPTDYWSPKALYYKDQDRLRLVGEDEWYDLTGSSPYASGTPRYYRIDGSPEWRLRVYPVDSAASQATTINGAHTSSVTTITVASTTGFRSAGRILVTTSGVIEEIKYTGTTATTFTGAVRGVGGTTAASHNNTDAVAQADLHLYYYPEPVKLAGSDKSQIPGPYRHILAAYAAHECFQKRGDIARAQFQLQIYAKGISDLKKLSRDSDGEEGISLPLSYNRNYSGYP